MSDDPVRVGDTLEGILEKIEQVRVRQRAANRVPPERLYHCALCLDSGFETVGVAGQGTVRRCPAGCKPERVKLFDVPRPRRQSEPADTEVF